MKTKNMVDSSTESHYSDFGVTDLYYYKGEHSSHSYTIDHKTNALFNYNQLYARLLKIKTANDCVKPAPLAKLSSARQIKNFPTRNYYLVSKSKTEELNNCISKIETHIPKQFSVASPVNTCATEVPEIKAKAYFNPRCYCGSTIEHANGYQIKEEYAISIMSYGSHMPTSSNSNIHLNYFRKYFP